MKKIIGSILIFIIMINVCLATDSINYYGISNGATKINSINFSDVSGREPNYWAKPAIYEIAALEIMNGNANSSFDPVGQITNEQAITTVLNSLGKAEEVSKTKTVPGSWSDPYIKYALNNGLITEKVVMRKADIKADIEAMKNAGVYIRDNVITREEIAALLVKAFSLVASETVEPIAFADKSQVGETKISAVDTVSSLGIMVGSDDDMFYPKNGLTRAEFAQIFKNCEKYFLDKLKLIKKTGFVEGVSENVITISDSDGNNIKINVQNGDIPVLRGGILAGKTNLRSSDEIELFVDMSRLVKFIHVLDEGISGPTEITGESTSKQGIVTGNSPYFCRISVKDKNGEVATYTYGNWTEIYKDNRATVASDILQGDTVYLEFDEIGDLVVIRGVTNSVISYGTIVNIDDDEVTVTFDDATKKTYDLSRIPVYKSGEEITLSKLNNGEYAKIYSSQSELIKVEIVEDERTAEGVYKGYISDINLIQDRMILRNPYRFKEGVWSGVTSSFVTLPLDKEMMIYYDGNKLEKAELGDKQVGKYAYIATRSDTQVLEKVKAITIETDLREMTEVGELKSFTSSNGSIKLYDVPERIYVDNTTIFVINGKIVSSAFLNKEDRLSVTANENDGKNIAKIITSVAAEDDREITVYAGKVKKIDTGEELTLTAIGRYEDEEWNAINNKTANFVINANTRIYSATSPINIEEFTEEAYKDNDICIVTYGDEIIVASMVTIGTEPYIAIGSVSKVSDTGFDIKDVEYFDFVEEEWTETANETVTTGVNTIITKNGRFARQKEIETNQEVVIIKATATGTAGVVIITY